jgi:electron transfer flavoprotein alpha/beta subunit
VEKGKYDLILTGAQADDGAAQVGGMLAAMLDYPYASLVNKIDRWKAINSRWAVKSKAATRR